uniref:Uncharacterized protein n=1 Tax=Glossina palpalis gambiensis TaxID=67801 RepID=A0A1B0BR83_9MUSC
MISQRQFGIRFPKNDYIDCSTNHRKEKIVDGTNFSFSNQYNLAVKNHELVWFELSISISTIALIASLGKPWSMLLDLRE